MKPELSELDPAIAPLIEQLWKANIRTFQSCSGHSDSEQHPTACVWIGREALDIDQALTLSRRTGIEAVSLLCGREKPEAIWEIIFAGETDPLFFSACVAILEVLIQHEGKRIAINTFFRGYIEWVRSTGQANVVQSTEE